ncbi:MAG: hypothetical protein Q8R82_10170 [Hyphomonadaceae bacterium]|nr:hypothetical protein [Hyphomonadaceae bacterium]
MTDLLMRYLAAVERRLPEKDAKDIVAELRDVLSAKVEAREAGLGRAANAGEVAAILKAFGHPVVVASRYSGNDYVIGPAYYPWFWHVQRIAVGLAVAIAFGLATLRGLGSDELMRAVMRGVNGAIEAAVITFGVVTILFVVAERTKMDMKWADKWDPKSLPRDQIREPKSFFESAFTVVFDIVFLLFWAKVVQFPNEIPVRDGASAALAFSPAWEAVYWPVLVLAAGATAVHIADIVYPAWSRARALVSIAGHLGGLAIMWVLYGSRPLVEVTPLNGADPVEMERVMRTVEGVVDVSLGVVALVWVITIGFEIRRLWRTSRGPATSSGAAI